MRRIEPGEFVRRLKAATAQTDKRFALFVGAGCSISSGIPGAGALVMNAWLPRLKDFRSPGEAHLVAWAKTQCPDFDENNPALSYGSVMEELFLNSAEERQREIEALCESATPAFGYACLAALVAQPEGWFNVVLTTNFDDLVADALYLFTQGRPLVITHEALAGFIRPTRTRPLVVKLHGDHRLAPKNTAQETQVLEAQINSQVSSLLHDRGLIFLGYGGNDAGIAEMLRSLPEEALPLGVYWVSSAEPTGAIRPWLDQRDAVWVTHRDFDELMVLVHATFELPHPDAARFDNIFKSYFENYSKVRSGIIGRSEDGRTAAALKQATEQVDRSLDAAGTLAKAREARSREDFDTAERILREGIQTYPDSFELCYEFGHFMLYTRRDYSSAAATLGKAVALKPDDLRALLSRAYALSKTRLNNQLAREIYDKALAIAPQNRVVLISYANFLWQIDTNYEYAEVLYEQARRIDATEPNTLVNFTGLLFAKGDIARARRMLEMALSHPNMPRDGQLEANFYAFALGAEQTRSHALRALKALLESGARSLDWNFAPIIEQCSQRRRTRLSLLADVISGVEPIDSLQSWRTWKSLPG